MISSASRDPPALATWIAPNCRRTPSAWCASRRSSARPSSPRVPAVRATGGAADVANSRRPMVTVAPGEDGAPRRWCGSGRRAWSWSRRGPVGDRPRPVGRARRRAGRAATSQPSVASVDLVRRGRRPSGRHPGEPSSKLALASRFLGPSPSAWAPWWRWRSPCVVVAAPGGRPRGRREVGASPVRGRPGPRATPAHPGERGQGDDAPRSPQPARRRRHRRRERGPRGVARWRGGGPVRSLMTGTVW